MHPEVAILEKGLREMDVFRRVGPGEMPGKSDRSVGGYKFREARLELTRVPVDAPLAFPSDLQGTARHHSTAEFWKWTQPSGEVAQ